ncbi:TPA: hypothetical protein ACNOH7_002510 [Vibrio fluvialis]
MSDIAIQIHLLDEPEGWVWDKLRAIIEEGQASSLGARTYEFHTYGDACVFQAELDHHGIKYEATSVDND